MAALARLGSFPIASMSSSSSRFLDSDLTTSRLLIQSSNSLTFAFEYPDGGVVTGKQTGTDWH